MTRTVPTALWSAVVIAAMAGFGVAPHAAAASACSDLGGTVGPEQTCHVQGTGTGYTLDFSFPVDYPDQQAITDFLTDQRDQMADYATKFPPNTRPAPYELDITGTAYQRGTPQPATQSVVFEIQNDTGAANQGRPTISYKALNYDLGRGAPITFATLFKPGTTPLDVYRAASSGTALPPPDAFGAHDYQNFAIDDDAVIFFFDHDFLNEEGPDQVSVPRADLAELLA